MPTTGSWRSLVRCALGVVVVALVTFVCVRLQVGSTIPALLYLMAVVLVALGGSFAASALLSVIAVVCLQYLFLSPRFSLKMTNPVDAVAASVFLATALAITRLMIARRRAEKAQQEQAALLDVTHDMIFVRSVSDDVITYWNRAAEESYGWTSGEAIGAVPHDLLKTVFPVPRAEMIAEVTRAGRWEGELVHTRRDGSDVVVASRWSLQRDDQGRPAAILETNNDITVRRRAEAQLRESERRYRNIFETAGVSLWEEDFSQVKALLDDLKRQGVHDLRPYLAAHPDVVQQAISLVKVRDVNQATVRLFAARSKTELLVSLHRVFGPETPAVFAEEMIALAEGLTSFESETTLQTLKGERLSVLFTITFPPPASGLDSVLVSIMDITGRKRAEEALRRSEEQWRDVFENNPTMYFMVDAAGKVMAVNPFGAEQLGYRVEELVGQPVLKVFHESDREAVRRNFAQCLKQLGQPMSWELRKVRKPGSVIWVREMAKAVPRQTGPIVLIACEDITEQKRAEEALRQAQAELAHVTRVTTMGELAASLAHELNQSLTGVVTNASASLRWLGRDPPDRGEATEAVRRIIRDANRASEVITHTRALLKKSGAEKAPLDLSAVIRDVLALVQPELSRHGIVLHELLAEDLPSVPGVRVQLQQVVLNLIMNGVEAMADLPDRSRDLMIRSQRQELDGRPGVGVAVQDAGIGIAEENRDRLFEPFYTTKSHGLGMGLSICRSIIQAHGGRLWETPNAGPGATFQFVLPARSDPGP